MRATSTVVPSAIGCSFSDLRAPVLGADPHLTALARPCLDRDHDDGAPPDTFEAFDGTDGMRFIIRSSGLRVSSSAATVTTAKTITWIPMFAAEDARRRPAASAPSAG